MLHVDPAARGLLRRRLVKQTEVHAAFRKQLIELPDRQLAVRQGIGLALKGIVARLREEGLERVIELVLPQLCRAGEAQRRAAERQIFQRLREDLGQSMENVWLQFT